MLQSGEITDIDRAGRPRQWPSRLFEKFVEELFVVNVVLFGRFGGQQVLRGRRRSNNWFWRDTLELEYFV